MTSIDNSYLLGLFGGSGSASYTPTASPLASSLGTTSAKTTPTPPWRSLTPPPASDLVKQALLGRNLINENATKLDVKGASDDYRKLFTLYQGLNSLSALADRMTEKGLSDTEKAQIRRAFASGLTEVGGYADEAKLENLRLTRGAAMTKDQATVGVKRADTTYETSVLHAGTSDEAVAAFQGAVKFDLTVKTFSGTQTVRIDLADMGSQTRSMANVVNYVNGKLEAAGLKTRFATHRTPGEAQTVKVGDKTVTLPAKQDQWSFEVRGDSSETLTFSAPETAEAVYVAQMAGKPAQTKTTIGPTGAPTTTTTRESTLNSQLVKFQADTSTTAAPPPAAAALPGQANWVDGRSFAETLGKEVGAVHATATAADGSVYVLADVTDTSDGQTIKGDQDVALLKYDTAGNLLYTRTLGAGTSASGLALSVSTDGKIAVAGSITGKLDASTVGVDDKTADSFVTLYNADGEEVWTKRRAARAEDEATAVAFGADGSVYVAGRAKSAMPGSAGGLGGWDSYVQGFDSAGKSLFTTQFGTGSDDKVAGMAVSGSSLVVAGVEGGEAVVRKLDLQAGAPPVMAAVRDLGAVQGSIAGVAISGGSIVLAGTSANAALAAGTVNGSNGGGTDAFVAKLSLDLAPAASDRLSWFGGAGTDNATAMTVGANGEVWIAGSSTGALPGLAQVGVGEGAKDAFVARIDADTGAVGWSRRYTSTDSTVAPTSIAVDLTGASALDRFGLPKGTIDFTDSKLLTANSSLRVGDEFYIRTREGGFKTPVRIEAGETLTSLASKISRAAGFSVKVEQARSGDSTVLRLRPLNDRSDVEVVAGKPGKDALPALGLTAGVISNNDTSSGKDYDKVFGLGLSDALNLADDKAVATTRAALAKAISAVRSAYNYIANPPSDAKGGHQNTSGSGKAPAYLTNQIANYQAALARLGG